MPHLAAGSAQLVRYAVTAAAIAIVVLVRLRGMRQLRPLRLETLWIVPAIYLAATLAVLWSRPPAPGLWPALAAALAAGAALGWRRGATMRIGIDPATHRLNQRASPAALLFIVLLLVARLALRYEGRALGLDVMAVTDLVMLFALGLFAATRAEMFVRARALLAAARGGASLP